MNIYERKEGGAVELWKHVYPHGDLPGKLLPADECIVYDRIAFPDAPLLASVRPYNAVMTAAAERDRKLSRRWYGGNFCMIDAAGKRGPHQILWDKRESGGLGISAAAGRSVIGEMAGCTVDPACFDAGDLSGATTPLFILAASLARDL